MNRPPHKLKIERPNVSRAHQLVSPAHRLNQPATKPRLRNPLSADTQVVQRLPQRPTRNVATTDRRVQPSQR